MALHRHYRSQELLIEECQPVQLFNHLSCQATVPADSVPDVASFTAAMIGLWHADQLALNLYCDRLETNARQS